MGPIAYNPLGRVFDIMINAGIAGLGKWGQVLVNSIHGKSDKIKVPAGCTGRKAKAEAYCREKGIDLRDGLADLLNDSKPKARTDEELLADIADILKFPVEDLKGRSRQRPLVTARQIAMYVFRELTDLSYPAIARLFGGRDHTTVIHANEKIQRLMSERKQIYDQVTDLLQQLKA